MVPACFDPETFSGIWFGLPKLPGHFIQIVRDHHDLAVGDADKFIGIRRLWIFPRFFVDSAGKFTIEVLHRAGC
jgi:hypothetical protein